MWFAAGALGQLFVFSLSGNKSAVLSPVALLAACLLFRSRRSPAGTTCLLAAPVVALAMLALDRLTGSLNGDWVSLIVRRFLVTPGLLTAGYVQVFDDIEKAKLGHSIFSSSLHYPYAAEPPSLVGAEFFGDPQVHANANLLADGYANFGYLGIVLACLVLVVLLWTIDDAAVGLPLGFASLLFLMPALALADSGILTTMLTHGFLASALLCAVAPRTGWPGRDSPHPPDPPDPPVTAAPCGVGLGESAPA